MPTVTRPFEGVRAGEIYPVVIEAGEECPPELLDAAIALGCVDVQADEIAGKTGEGVGEGQIARFAKRAPKAPV
ncbi:hypothetical protein [Pannonibacter tanglangensis]|uniref:Uncharacterized protein n=1 Tax=Pannonibacter tanglangensis TaxID=2750084 RepID=A0ABW9ZH17_9HYPH|nr:hypothetical protein [Pannonibacter sp. XCT-34]NBN64150.1 hypothetical protein [Pannonibacter sp. XCT-34]